MKRNNDELHTTILTRRGTSFRLDIFAYALFLFLFPSAVIPEESPWLVRFADSDIKNPDIGKFMQRNNVCALLVVYKGALKVEIYDDSMTTAGDPKCEETSNTRNREYGIASVTKSVTSTLLGLLISKMGKPEIGQKIDEIYVGLSDSAFGCRTLRELLLMNGGTSWKDNQWIGKSDEEKMKKAVQDDGQEYFGYLKDYLRDQPCAESSKHEYQAIDTTVVGLIVDYYLQQKAGIRLQDGYTKWIWKELRMEGSFRWKGEDSWKWRKVNKKWQWLENNPGLAAPYCCLYAWPRDLARFGQYILKNYKAENDDSSYPLAKWVRSSVENPVRIQKERCSDPKLYMDYGYQWWVFRGRDGNKKDLGFTALGKGGQFIRILPEHDAVIVQLSDRNQDITDIECESYQMHHQLLESVHS